MKCEECQWNIDGECTEPEGQCPENETDEPIVTHLEKLAASKNRTLAFRKDHCAAILSKNARKL